MKREANNSHDVNAVAVYREDVIVGHIPGSKIICLLEERCEQSVCRS